LGKSPYIFPYLGNPQTAFNTFCHGLPWLGWWLGVPPWLRKPPYPQIYNFHGCCKPSKYGWFIIAYSH
jgi:hypothetical protein